MQRCTHFPKIRSHHRILCARRVTWSKFHTEDPNIWCLCTKFCHLCDPAARICTSLI